jgi:hypothetical protein
MVCLHFSQIVELCQALNCIFKGKMKIEALVLSINHNTCIIFAAWLFTFRSLWETIMLGINLYLAYESKFFLELSVMYRICCAILFLAGMPTIFDLLWCLNIENGIYILAQTRPRTKYN